jgi:hypothetical protein
VKCTAFSRTYGECTAFDQAEIGDVKGCTYTITPTSTTTGTFASDCGSTASESTVPTASCDVTIAGRMPTGSVDLASTGTGATEFVKMTATVTGIAYAVDSTIGRKEGEATTCGSVGAHTAECTGVVNEKGLTTSAHATQAGIKVD